MSEPENEIERELVRAITEPAARPGFLRMFMAAEVFIVLVPEGGAPIAPGPDGSATVPPGAKLNLMTMKRGEETLVPIFTAPSRVRAWFAGEHIVASDKVSTLFTNFGRVPFVLNPGSDIGKEFTVGEIERLMAGDFETGLRHSVLDQPEQFLLAHPAQPPEALIAALARELGAVRSVSGACLMLASRAGNPAQSWMLGVEHSGDWNEVNTAIARAVSGSDLQGRSLDATPLTDSELSTTLRTGIPIPIERIH
jgi:hypothetical protein